MNTDKVVKETQESPRLQELYSIAESLELSLLEEISEDGLTTVLTFFNYDEKAVVMSVATYKDRTEAVYLAIEKAIAELETMEDDQ